VAFATSAVGLGPIPGWWKYNWYDLSNSVNGGEPTLSLFPFSLGDHPFGQDRIGRDYFAMTMRGIQNSFVAMVLITGIALMWASRWARSRATSAAGSTRCSCA
jgi:peptide/nickel transport system permease protein